MKEKIGIDLTWVRHGKIGGTESNTRNILDGIAKLNNQDNLLFILFVTKDNADSFKKYSEYKCFELYVCNILSSNKLKRVIWQNMKFGKLLKRKKIRLLFEPVYGMPFWGMSGIKVITTIHDLQALHYPQYFKRIRNIWMKLSWRNAVKSSYKVIAISEYVKNDIIENYKVAPERIDVIYDAVHMDMNSVEGVDSLKKYGVEPDNYFFTVSYFLPHKNLKTLILVIKELKRRKSPMFKKLVICGANSGNSRAELEKFISDNGLDDDIVILPYISVDLRNRFYLSCSSFLFPSIFEGFGMPPIEAMAYGKLCITTKCTSIPEVTGMLAAYVDDPLNVDSWIYKIENPDEIPSETDIDILLKKYMDTEIAKQYIIRFKSALYN